VRYATVEQLRDVPALQSAESGSQVLNGATKEYSCVVLNPFISDGDLRAWAQTEQLDPDRLNMAIEPLKQVGMLADMEGGDEVMLTLDLSALRLSELDRLLEANKIDVPAGATKEEKMAAFRGRMP
jgi:hypothetical protein